MTLIRPGAVGMSHLVPVQPGSPGGQQRAGAAAGAAGRDEVGA